jgi:hypothetical protein
MPSNVIKGCRTFCSSTARPGCADPSSGRFSRRSSSHGRSSHRSTVAANPAQASSLARTIDSSHLRPTVRSHQPKRSSDDPSCN